MKIRKGFVSNSSSSSFVVVFPEEPTSRAHVQEMLKHGERYKNPYYDQKYSPAKSWTSFEVAERVWIDYCRYSMSRDIGKEEIVQELMGGYFPEELCEKLGVHQPQYEDFVGDDGSFSTQEYQGAFDEHYKHLEADLLAYVEDWINTHNGHYAIFEYSDNNGVFETALEHGDLFANLPHIRNSKH